jgi:hypothetical protein
MPGKALAGPLGRPRTPGVMHGVYRPVSSGGCRSVKRYRAAGVAVDPQLVTGFGHVASAPSSRVSPSSPTCCADRAHAVLVVR